MIFTIRPLWGLGNNGGPHRDFYFVQIAGLPLVSDSVPKMQRPTEEKTAETTDKIQGSVEEKAAKMPDIIKEVPKARRQIKPVAIPSVIPLKPIKIIKPQIIRNTIKVLH